MDRPRFIRGLKITLSTIFGGLCLLFVVLWARSSRIEDSVLVRSSPSRLFIATSLLGRVEFSTYNPAGLSRPFSIVSRRIDEGSRKHAEFLRQQEFAHGLAIVHPAATYWTVTISHAFLIIALLVPALAPWSKFIRRFSLRTLLIAITLAAVAMAALSAVM